MECVFVDFRSLSSQTILSQSGHQTKEGRKQRKRKRKRRKKRWTGNDEFGKG